MIRVLASILVEIMAFFISVFLVFLGEIILPSVLQLDFMLLAQLVILFGIACIVALTLALLDGKITIEIGENRNDLSSNHILRCSRVSSSVR